MSSVELDIILLMKWQSVMKMPWLVVVWTIVALCFKYFLSFSQDKLQNIQNTLAHIITNHRQYALVTPILKQLYWLPVNYHCMFKTASLVYKFFHSDCPSNVGSSLHLRSCFYNNRCSHPHLYKLAILFFHSQNLPVTQTL